MSSPQSYFSTNNLFQLEPQSGRHLEVAAEAKVLRDEAAALEGPAAADLAHRRRGHGAGILPQVRRPYKLLKSDRGSILASLPTAPILILDVPEMCFDVAEIYSMALARGKCTEA